MQLAHAFAHKAAIAAMTEAVRADPTCAMCLWGQAWASGPTINYGKSEDEVKALGEVADKAAQLAEAAGDPEVRCWTIPAGTLAPQAAGAIHTDFERGFIKAEVRGGDCRRWRWKRGIEKEEDGRDSYHFIPSLYV